MDEATWEARVGRSLFLSEQNPLPAHPSRGWHSLLEFSVLSFKVSLHLKRK